MNTLVLLVAKECAWSPEVWAIEGGGQRAADGQIMIERGPEWLSIARDERVLDDFDDEERLRVAALVGEATTYLVEWRGNVLVETFLRSIPPGTRAAIDNDHGLLVPVSEVAGEPVETWVRASSLP